MGVTLTGGHEEIVVIGDFHGDHFFVVWRSGYGDQVQVSRMYVVNVHAGVHAGDHRPLTVLGQRE